jgi:hypothetical protein
VCENQQNYSQISVMHLNNYKSLADCMISALLEDGVNSSSAAR